ncbi:hypothetical protein C3943_18725 [Lysinibacillus sp. B2A1]|nr:hypothetical protein C3943_18725 [Lysinibacillus sp. B2A1]
MVLSNIKSKWFLLVISIYLTFGFYLLYLTYSKTFINITVKEENGEWLVVDPYFEDWATKQQIEPGDIIIKVDGAGINNIANLKYDFVLRAANDLMIKKPNGNLIDIHIKPLDIPQQFYYVLVAPTCYYFLTFIISLYLYFKQKNWI